MSPEQVQATDVDQRTDIYAVGLMLFTALMGKTAFKRGNPLAVLMAQAQKDPPTFAEAWPEHEVPASLEWIVQTCIKKPVEERFVSMHELLRALKAVEKVVRGDLADLELALVDGRVVLPDGLDVSSEYRAVSGEVAARRDLGVPDLSTTLVGGASVANQIAVEPSATQTVVVLGRGGAAAIGLLAVALVIVGIGIGGWFIRDAVLPGQTVVPTLPETHQTPVFEVIEVSLISLPAGAEVERDGAFLGSTPLKLTIPKGENWDVEVKLAEYESKRVRLTGNPAEVTVKLVPIVAVSPAPGATAPSPRSKPAPKPARRGDIADPWED